MDDIYIDEIVSLAEDCEPCERFQDYVDGWGRGEIRTGDGEDEQAEIIARVHSLMGENDEDWGDQEGLPADSTVRAEALEDIHSFAYRFARCIDYLQWGNESYGGAGGYGFRYTDIPNCTWDPEQGPNPYRLFSSLPDDDCRVLALAEIIEWQTEQMWAALVGSALAGRPLRMTSSGVNHENVKNGYDAGNDTNPELHAGYVGLVVTTEVAEMCNLNQMYFAMHIHYDAVQSAQDAIEKLVDTYTGDGSPWDVPSWRICTELGAATDFGEDEIDWWDFLAPGVAWSNKEDYVRFFFDLGSGLHPSRYWETFITDWEDAQFGGDIQLDDVFGWLAAADFAGLCHSAIQFDSGSPSDPSRHQVEGLRATQLRLSQYTQDSNRFTPIKAYYIAAGTTYKISGFTPHPDSCEGHCPCN